MDFVKVAEILFAVVIVLLVAIRFWILPRKLRAKPPSLGMSYDRAMERTHRQGQVDPDVQIDRLREGTERQVDLYAGTVYTAETRGQAAERQIREQMQYGGDTPVDLPDGNGGRVLIYKGERHQLDWCEPPPEPVQIELPHIGPQTEPDDAA